MYQGRQGYGAKRSAPPGGGGRSHPPGRPFSNVPHNTEVLVETNQNKLLLLADTNASSMSDYVQCKVDIQNAGYRRIEDEAANGECTREWKVFESTLESKEKFLKTRLPWRIIKKWANDNGKDIAYDGASTAYFPSASSAPGDGEEYRVQVKKDCEQNDPDADSVRDSWFSLTFTRTNVISSQDVQATVRGDSSDASEAIATMFTAVLKTSAILADHNTLEAKSSTVFSPINMQQGQLERGIQQESRDRLKFILEGVRMTTKLQNGGMVVETEPVPQYVNKERHRDDTRVPLLSVSGQNATIAGVRIDNAHRPIAEFQRAKIEEIIEKKTVNVVYSSERDGQEARHVVFKNKSVRKCQREDDPLGNGKMFIWNPSEYTFDCNGQATTVASYFQSQHSIQLRYPHMPLIYVDNVTKHGGGWFPVELVYQALSKSKENTEEMVTEILKYHDTYAGKRYIERVRRKLENLSLTGGQGNTFRDRLRRWNIEIDNRAVVEKAKVLSAPRIKFKNSNARPNNGSFNLRGAQFSRPAKLSSFAVVNFAPGNRNEYVNTVLRVSRSHGIEIPYTTIEAARNPAALEDLTFQYSGRDPVDDAQEACLGAIQRAEKFHLYDRSGFYRRNNVFFRTQCLSEQKSEIECLVLPPDNAGEPLGLLLDFKAGSPQSQSCTHRVVTRDGNEYDARLMVNIHEAPYPIDPLDFRYHDGRHQACRGDGAWVDVYFEGYCYECGANGLILREDEIQSKQFLHFVKDWELDFPSVLFVCLPDDGMALYNRIKVLSNYLGGCATQCAVMPTFQRQRNRDQYASNIATKLNAKLATTFEKAVSWTSANSDGSGSDDKLPWIGDRPTLVVGVGMVHGRGRSAKTVFAASVCLDSGCMRLAHSCFVNRRSETILAFEMQDIIETSIKHYKGDSERDPERILFYRDGLSDGNFVQADIEIKSIREAAEKILGNRNIPITFVIVQSQSLGFKMVPAGETRRDNRGKPINNVNSGTVLECGDNKSWYLVAHGGLKGTSKPVKYVTHLNENEQSGLTLRNLIDCTNQMSFKYPSATKAVREVPVLKYAKRLANQVLNSLLVLETGCNWSGHYRKLVCPDNDLLPEAERRPYVESRDMDTGEVSRSHNLVEMHFRNHLAA